MLEKYPDAAEYLWNGIDIKQWVANDGLVNKPKKRRKRYLRKFIKIVERDGLSAAIDETLCYIGLKEKEDKEKMPVYVSKPITWGMNPVDSWYMQKPNIKEKMDGYFESSMEKYSLTDLPLEKMKFIYNNGCAQDKAMCITTFSAIDEFGYVLGLDR